MKTRTAKTIGVAWLALSLMAPAATVMVDWLKLPAGSSPGGFQLMDDNSAALGGGRLIIAKGVSFLGHPSQRTLNWQSWLGATGFSDSVTGLADVSAMNFRVVPESNQADYAIQLSVPAGRKLVLVVGDLFRNAMGSTAGISILAQSDTESVPVTLAGLYGWNNGATSLNQDLTWDESLGTLSTKATSNGDSKLAFLEIGPISGLNPRLVLSVPQGYASGIGDSVIIGVGAVVPEPGVLTLTAICGILGLTLRRRI